MNIQGYRGYIGSRMIERSVPQHIQQLVIRDYCNKNGLKFLLSATEYCMDGSTFILESLLKENIQGIVFYSIFLMPTDKEKRNLVYESGKDIRFAAENTILNRELIETTFLISSLYK